MRKNNKAQTLFVIGVTSDWVFAAANVVIGLNKTTKIGYDVRILHNGISADDKKNLLRLKDSIQFQQFNFEEANTKKFNRVSMMAFSRFECFRYLNDYEYVVWLDADITLEKGLDEITRYSCESGISLYKHENTPISVSFSSEVQGFDMNAPCYNDGIFVISQKLKDEGEAIAKWLYEATIRYYHAINSDQAVFNLMLQQFQISPSNLPMIYNSHPGKNDKEAHIIHPWGEGKFWNKFFYESWDMNYNEWTHLSGCINEQYEVFRSSFLEKKKRKVKIFDSFKAIRRKIIHVRFKRDQKFIKVFGVFLIGRAK